MRPLSISVLCYVVGVLGVVQLGMVQLIGPGDLIFAGVWIAAALATIASAMGLWQMRTWGPITFFVGFGAGVMMLAGVSAQWVNGWAGQIVAYGVPAVYALIVMPHWAQMRSNGN